MIEIAKKHAADQGVAEKCDFRVGDFMELDFDAKFDATLAIGVFDYVNNQVPFLEKLGGLANRKVVTTWPVIWTWRALPRWIRLNLAGCPVYFYKADRVRKLHEEAGLKVTKLVRVGKIFFVVASPSEGWRTIRGMCMVPGSSAQPGLPVTSHRLSSKFVP